MTLLPFLFIFINMCTVRGFRVDLQPKRALFRAGDRRELRCSVLDCQDRVLISWATLEDKPLSVQIRMDKNVSVATFDPVKTEHEGTFVCKVSCARESKQPRAVIKVYSFPAPPIIRGHEELIVGQVARLSCQVYHLHPTEQVSISWSKGNSMQRTSGDTLSIFSFTPTLNDTGTNVTCQVKLDLPGLPEEESMRETKVLLNVSSQPLQVQLLPATTTAERGSELVLTCQTSGCPQPVFSWRTPLGEPVPSAADTQGPLSLLHLASLDVSDQGDYVCSARCGSISRDQRARVNVYSFPSDPVLEVDGPVLQGTEAVLRCSVLDVFPANQVRVQWLAGNTELKAELSLASGRLQNTTSVLRLPVDLQDPDQILTCRAQLEHGGTRRQRESSTTLLSHCGPRNTSIWVSPGQTVDEGQTMRVTCLSGGGPGRLVLRRMSQGQHEELQWGDASSISISLPWIRLEQSGLYQCEASNQHGSQLVNASVVVRAPPRNTTVLILPSTDVQEGQNVTIGFRAVSFPPAEAVLTKLSGGTDVFSSDGTFVLLKVRTSHSGLYQVNISNQLGHQTHTFYINVRETTIHSIDVGVIVVPAVCIVIILVIVASLLSYLRTHRKTGFYQLTKAAPASA